CAAAACVASCFCAEARTGDEPRWNRAAATAYLDARAGWWADWKGATRDHGTFCISCHTSLPYALARSALTQESEDSPNERRLYDNVRQRVRLWTQVKPYYGDGDADSTKRGESRGTEAVLNALILTSHDV